MLKTTFEKHIVLRSLSASANLLDVKAKAVGILNFEHAVCLYATAESKIYLLKTIAITSVGDISFNREEYNHFRHRTAANWRYCLTGIERLLSFI